VLYALGNSSARDLAQAAVERLEDDSALVRGAAVWALARLDPARFEAERDERAASEPDPDVREDWALGASPGPQGA